jgi:predicted CoA-binding protein
MNKYINNESRLQSMNERETFWDNRSFVVVTDKTKPAMKLTIEELKKRGMTVYVVDLSDNSDEGSIEEISGLPSDIDSAVIGVTRRETADVIEELRVKGIKKFWIHWRTDTAEVKRICQQADVHCITGKCPMMYLAPGGLNMHSMHRAVAKIFDKY